MTEREMRNVESANLPEQAVPTKRWRKGLGSAGSRDDRMLFTGDIHNKGSRLCPMIEEAANRVDAGTIVLLGDLLNEWTVTAEGEAAAFEMLAEWVHKQRRHRKVIVLLGNHDLAYYVQSGTRDFRAFTNTCPGFHYGSWPDVHPLLLDMKPQIMFGFTDKAGHEVLASHAGITAQWFAWMCNELVQAGESLPANPSAAELADMVNVFSHGHIGDGIRSFGLMVGPERGGWMGSIPSPCWAGMNELANDPLQGFNQIVGHTPVYTVLSRRCAPGTGAHGKRSRARLWYADTHSLMRNGAPIGDSSFLFYDKASGDAWRVSV